MKLPLFHELPRDVLTQIATALVHDDLRCLVSTNTTLRRSVFRELLLSKSRLELPPNDDVVEAIVSGLDGHVSTCIRASTVAEIRHIHHLSSLHGLQKLCISSDGYMREYEPFLRIDNLEALFPQLQSLDVSCSAILSVASLATVTHLVELDVSHTAVTDLSPLKTLVKLRHLSLENTHVKSINVVASLPLLETLNLNTTRSLDDLTPLIYLRKLSRLSVSDKELTEVDTLMALAPTLTSLEAIEVRFPGASVPPQTRQEALSALSQLESLTMWPLSWTQTLQPLHSMAKLKTLDIRFPPFTDLAPLQALSELEDLRLMLSAARDTSPLRVLKKLKRLTITGCNNDPSSVDFLLHLPLLKELSVSGEIHTSTIAQLTQLESVELHYTSASWGWIPRDPRLPSSLCAALKAVTQLSLRFPVGDPADLSVLSCMTHLEYLNLGFATPKELPTPEYFHFLHSLINLRELRLAGGGLCDARDLRFLTKLEILDISSTQVEALEPLAALQNLRHVELLYTPIASIEPLTRLRRLQRVQVPREVSCVPLVRAALPELREILHEHINCMWHPHHRERFQDLHERQVIPSTSAEVLNVLETVFGEYTGDY